MMCPNSAFSNAFSSAAFSTVVHTASVAAAPPSTPRNSRRLMRPTQPAESETIPLWKGLLGRRHDVRFGSKADIREMSTVKPLSPPKADLDLRVYEYRP